MRLTLSDSLYVKSRLMAQRTRAILAKLSDLFMLAPIALELVHSYSYSTYVYCSRSPAYLSRRLQSCYRENMASKISLRYFIATTVFNKK